MTQTSFLRIDLYLFKLVILLFFITKINSMRMKKYLNKIKTGSIIFGVGDSHTSFIWNKK